jgi:hypothetical protein
MSRPLGGSRETGSRARLKVRCWHVGDVERGLILVREAPNNGHVRDAARPPLMTHKRHPWLWVAAAQTSPVA